LFEGILCLGVQGHFDSILDLRLHDKKSGGAGHSGREMSFEPKNKTKRIQKTGSSPNFSSLLFLPGAQQ
jgi:hypothetical protein